MVEESGSDIKWEMAVLISPTGSAEHRPPQELVSADTDNDRCRFPNEVLRREPRTWGGAFEWAFQKALRPR
jgi:hypothetical protein